MHCCPAWQERGCWHAACVLRAGMRQASAAAFAYVGCMRWPALSASVPAGEHHASHAVLHYTTRSKSYPLSTEVLTEARAGAQEALGVGEGEVEAWVVRAIGRKLLAARIDQMRRTVAVTKCAQRTFSAAQWRALLAQLGAWKARPRRPSSLGCAISGSKAQTGLLNLQFCCSSHLSCFRTIFSFHSLLTPVTNLCICASCFACSVYRVGDCVW